MLYQVKLSPAEIKLLAALVGQPLERVATNGWAVEIRAGAQVLAVIPEEIATPDADHPYGDVQRPLVRADEEPMSPESMNVLVEKLGLVRAVNVVTILIGFSPEVDCPPLDILPGVVLPAGRGYGWVYYPPTRLDDAQCEVGLGTLVDLDIAFELVVDLCPSIVVYTRGFFVKASTHGLPSDEEWVALESYTRRSAS